MQWWDWGRGALQCEMGGMHLRGVPINNVWDPIIWCMVMITLSVIDCTQQTTHPVHEARLDRGLGL